MAQLKVIGLARLTKDVDLKATSNGHIANFSIAVNRTYKNKDGNYDVDFWNCISFNKTAELIAKYFYKGSQFYVDGLLQNNNWEKDGVMQYNTQILINTVEFIDKRAEQEKEKDELINEVVGNVEQSKVSVSVDEDLLPF